MGMGKERRTGTRFLRKKSLTHTSKTQKAAMAAVRQSGGEAVTTEMICMGNTMLYLFLVPTASDGTSYSQSV